MIVSTNQIRGRPRNAAATRAAILASAKRRFTSDSYDQVGVRQIAGDVGVDASLIRRYFGSKEELFAEVLADTGRDPMDILSGDRHDFGVRVARAMLDPEERTRQDSIDFINLTVRSTMSPAAGERVRKHIETWFIAPFTEWLGGSNATQKAWLTASVLMGVAVMRTIVSGPSVPSETTDAAVAQLATVLQTIVDSP